MPGRSIDFFVQFLIIAQGSVDDFDGTTWTSIENAFATKVGVLPSRVSATPTAGSVHLFISISAGDSNDRARQISDDLATVTASSSAMRSFLLTQAAVHLQVTSVGTPVVSAAVITPPMPPSQPPELVNGMGIVAIILGALVIVTIAVCAHRQYKTRQMRRMLEERRGDDYLLEMNISTDQSARNKTYGQLS